MPRKMPKSIHSWLIPKLRNASRWWPGKTIARDLAKVKVTVGQFANGKEKFKTFWKCAECQGLFERDQTQMDHIKPVVNVSGFKDWDTYINQLFCGPENYQCLCIGCHEKKTTSENKQRKKVKK